MTPANALQKLIKEPSPILALAPMQDISSRSYWELMARYSGADVYYTEFFRVHADSHLERWILDSITKNPTGKPVVAQMIGNDIPSLVRTAKQLQQYPIAAVDLNLGCPAPIVYRKRAGGGLLREPHQIDAIIGALREVVTVPLTVKMRIGFESPNEFEPLLKMLSRHAIDLLTVHGRTVKQSYRGDVNYDCIAQAAEALPCPVLANGNIFDPAQAESLLKRTRVRGLMIGRGAIRNPWIFEQIRQQLRGEQVKHPTGRDLLGYIQGLWDSETSPGFSERAQVERLKKFMNFVGEGVPAKEFLHAIRRAQSATEFFGICNTHLDHSEPLTLLPGSNEECLMSKGRLSR